MDHHEVVEAIKQICEEKNISYEAVIKTIESALAVAYRKDFGERGQNVSVHYNPRNAEMEIYLVKKIVENPLAEDLELLKDSMTKEQERVQQAIDAKQAFLVKGIPEDQQEKEEYEKESLPREESSPQGETASEDGEEKKKRFNPKAEIAVDEAVAIDPAAVLGDEIHFQVSAPSEYGRMAAQIAKQVVIQKLREAERVAIFDEYKDKQKTIVTGSVHRVDGKMVFIDLGHATGLLPPSEQIAAEQYRQNQKIKLFIIGVNQTNKGPEIIVSRSHPDMVRRLFEMEVPEIASGAIEIKGIAREAGSRTKIAVQTFEENIDPIGSCVGQRGTRVQTIINELGGEKIDIIEYDDDPVRFIVHALAPAKILHVDLNEEGRIAKAEVSEDQLSLAIGKAGQNVRLAARLTNWKIDIVKEGGETPESKKEEPQESESPQAHEPTKEEH